MPCQPVKKWVDAYKSGIQKHYKALDEGRSDKIEDFWSKWVDTNAQGLETAAPFAGGKPTSDVKSYVLKLEGLKTPVQSAKALADGWKLWFLALKFTPPPPVPPFSVITKCDPSPLGVELAYAALLSGLIAEFSKVPPSPDGAWEAKALAFGTLFFTATISGGVMLTGLSLSVPPVPLILPLSPAL